MAIMPTVSFPTTVIIIFFIFCSYPSLRMQRFFRYCSLCFAARRLSGKVSNTSTFLPRIHSDGVTSRV